jgi:hypothetical protein
MPSTREKSFFFKVNSGEFNFINLTIYVIYSKFLHLQTYKPLQTYKFTNLQTYKPTNFYIYIPTNLQTPIKPVGNIFDRRKPQKTPLN